jgi:hypothetical protein
MSVHERIHPGIYTDADDNIWRKMSDGSWTVNGQLWTPFPNANDMKPLRTDISTPAVSVADAIRYDFSKPVKVKYSDIIFRNQQEAFKVLESLTDILEIYPTASVSDLYDLVGLTTTFNDTRMGWKEIRGATVERTRGGYILNLPAPQPFN